MRSMEELALNGQQLEQQVPQIRVLHGKEEEKMCPTYPALKRCRLEGMKNRMNQWTPQMQTQPQEARLKQNRNKIHSRVRAQEEKH